MFSSAVDEGVDKFGKIELKFYNGANMKESLTLI